MYKCLAYIHTNITASLSCLFETMSMRTKPTPTAEYVVVNKMER